MLSTRSEPLIPRIEMDQTQQALAPIPPIEMDQTQQELAQQVCEIVLLSTQGQIATQEEIIEQLTALQLLHRLARQNDHAFAWQYTALLLMDMRDDVDRAAVVNQRARSEDIYPLFEAVIRNNLPLVNLLLSYGADPNGEPAAPSNEESLFQWRSDTALVYACRDRDIDTLDTAVIQVLIDRDAALNVRNEEGHSLAMIATVNRDIYLLQYFQAHYPLLVTEYAYNPEIHQCSPYELAQSMDEDGQEVANFWLGLRAINPAAPPLLHNLITPSLDELERTEILEESSAASPESAEPAEVLPVEAEPAEVLPVELNEEQVSLKQVVESCLALISEPQIFQRQIKDTEVLHRLARLENHRVAWQYTWLLLSRMPLDLQREQIINIPDRTLRYPLFYAAEKNNIALVNLLLVYNANPDGLPAPELEQDNPVNTALVVACERRNPATMDTAVIQQLLDKDASLNAVDAEGKSLAIIATVKRDIYLLRYFLSNYRRIITEHAYQPRVLPYHTPFRRALELRAAVQVRSFWITIQRDYGAPPLEDIPNAREDRETTETSTDNTSESSRGTLRSDISGASVRTRMSFSEGVESEGVDSLQQANPFTATRRSL